jgi:hypothetical protein
MNHRSPDVGTVKEYSHTRGISHNIQSQVNLIEPWSRASYDDSVELNTDHWPRE